MGSRPDVDNAVHPNPDAVFNALVTASAEVGANEGGRRFTLHGVVMTGLAPTLSAIVRLGPSS